MHVVKDFEKFVQVLRSRLWCLLQAWPGCRPGPGSILSNNVSNFSLQRAV